MRGGLKTACHRPTLVSAVDLGATRVEREELHRQVRLRAHLTELLLCSAVGDGSVVIEPETNGAT